MVSAARRNAWLRLDDAALLKQCREESYRSGGPGGQRRNKVETAMRLHHLPTKLIAHANDSRYLRKNRLRALHRLREKIALEVRAAFDLESPALPEELVKQRGAKGTMTVNQKNPAYPLIAATALDALAAADGSYARAGHALGITTSQLLKLLRADRALWRAAEQMKAAG